MCSIWLVVLVAANRYWAVCRPHVSARVWTTRRTIGYVTAVVVGVIAFNVPRMVEYRVEAVAVARSAVTTLPANATTSSPISYYYHYSTAHIETETKMESESESGVTAAVEWTLREVRTPFGMSAFYRYVYKVLFVNILLVLLPLVTLIVLSVFVIRALRQTPSYQLSLLHARPRLSEKQVPASPPLAAAETAAAAAAADAAAVADTSMDEVIKDDDVLVDSEGQGPQQQQQQITTTTTTMNGDPANIRAACDKDEKTTKARPKFSLVSLKVCEPTYGLRRSLSASLRAGVFCLPVIPKL